MLLSIGLLLALCILTVGSGRQASAATPVPAPTLRPLPPTPTLNYLYGRPTPTALPVLAPPTSFDPTGLDAGPAADTVINIYRYFNRDHLLDLVGGGVLAFIAITFIVNFINKRTAHSE